MHLFSGILLFFHSGSKLPFVVCVQPLACLTYITKNITSTHPSFLAATMMMREGSTGMLKLPR